MQNAAPRITALILISLAVYIIYIAAQWGLADVYYRPAKIQLRSWSLGKIELENKDWEKLHSSLSRALELDPYNPKIHENLALALEGRFANASIKNTEVETNRKLALEHYRQSTRLRPVWPYAWSDLALVKYRLGQIDDELFTALHNAERLGRWEPGIQRVVIDLGFILWRRLSDADRKFILETVSRSLQKQPSKTLHIVKKHGHLDIICYLHREKPKVSDYCKKQ